MKTTMKYKLNRLGLGVIASSALFASSAMAIPSLQIGDADGGTCNVYDITAEDCIVGGQFTVTSLEAGDAYLVFGAVPQTMSDTFTIDPMIGGASLTLVDSGYGDPPFEDTNSLPPHGIFDTWVEVYALTFDSAATVYNTQPGNEGDSAPGYIETIDLYLTALTDGLHIDLFRCTFGSVEGNNCRIRNGTDFAPFSHDATFVPVPTAVWLFGSGLLGLVAVARRKATGLR
ncbi:MAG: choice-of-anchor N protein [Pseudomonadota bacterium]